MRRSHYGERIAVLEAKVPELIAKVEDIHRDVKLLLAAHNRQQGALKTVKIAYGLVAAGATLLVKWAVDNWHSLTALGRQP